MGSSTSAAARAARQPRPFQSYEHRVYRYIRDHCHHDDHHAANSNKNGKKKNNNSSGGGTTIYGTRHATASGINQLVDDILMIIIGYAKTDTIVMFGGYVERPFYPPRLVHGGTVAYNSSLDSSWCTINTLYEPIMTARQSTVLTYIDHHPLSSSGAAGTPATVSPVPAAPMPMITMIIRHDQQAITLVQQPLSHAYTSTPRSHDQPFLIRNDANSSSYGNEIDGKHGGCIRVPFDRTSAHVIDDPTQPPRSLQSLAVAVATAPSPSSPAFGGHWCASHWVLPSHVSHDSFQQRFDEPWIFTVPLGNGRIHYIVRFGWYRNWSYRHLELTVEPAATPLPSSSTTATSSTRSCINSRVTSRARSLPPLYHDSLLDVLGIHESILTATATTSTTGSSCKRYLLFVYVTAIHIYDTITDRWYISSHGAPPLTCLPDRVLQTIEKFKGVEHMWRIILYFIFGSSLHITDRHLLFITSRSGVNYFLTFDLHHLLDDPTICRAVDPATTLMYTNQPSTRQRASEFEFEPGTCHRWRLLPCTISSPWLDAAYITTRHQPADTPQNVYWLEDKEGRSSSKKLSASALEYVQSCALHRPHVYYSGDGDTYIIGGEIYGNAGIVTPMPSLSCWRLNLNLDAHTGTADTTATSAMVWHRLPSLHQPLTNSKSFAI